VSTTDLPAGDESPFEAPPQPDHEEVDADDVDPAPHEPEPGQEPEPASQGPTEKEIEAIFRTVERATKAYTRKLEEAFGPAWEQYLGCPMCAGDFPGFIHVGKVGGFPREMVAGVNEILTGFKQVEYKQLPGFQTCPTCDGEGKGFTGSKVPDKQYADCPTCRARGYLAPQFEPANGHEPDAVQHFTAPDEAPYNAGDDVDEWGEPATLPDGRDNPNFGKMPHRKVLVDPYGVTAALTQRTG